MAKNDESIPSKIVTRLKTDLGWRRLATIGFLIGGARFGFIRRVIWIGEIDIKMGGEITRAKHDLARA
jgi:hypothetical protein